MKDIEKALLNPAMVFKNPQEVVESNDLSPEQKIEILRRWEYDVRELQVADEESSGHLGYGLKGATCGGRAARRRAYGADETGGQLRSRIGTRIGWLLANSPRRG
jgi:hypothetical protein